MEYEGALPMLVLRLEVHSPSLTVDLERGIGVEVSIRLQFNISL
jgi:hypothetical protein